MFKKPYFLAPVAMNAHKYSRGVVGIVAGSKEFPGAALLCVGGARRGGAGYIKFLDQSVNISEELLNQFPDVVHIAKLKDEKLDAIVVGPGRPRIITFPKEVAVVLDSAAIACVDAKRNPITVLTPHEGEVKFLGYTVNDRKTTAQVMADDLNVVIVLKGNRTIVAAPGVPALVDTIAGPELACAGSGDILAGLIGSMLASWKPANLIEAQKVAYMSVQMHSHAGKLARKAKNPVVATDILEALPFVNA